MMRQQIESRLIALKGEYDKGQTQLHQLENQVTSLRETMLRINGAVLVLEELLSSSALVTPADQQSVPNGAHALGQGRGEHGLESLTSDKKEN
jgi:hypothetical protein